MLPSVSAAPRVVDLAAYKKLALAIVARMARDFAGKDDDDLGQLDLPTIAFRRVKRQLEAGEFLYTRRDLITRHWLKLAGRDVDAPRGTSLDIDGVLIPDVHARLAELRAEFKRLKPLQVTRTRDRRTAA